MYNFDKKKPKKHCVFTAVNFRLNDNAIKAFESIFGPSEDHSIHIIQIDQFSKSYCYKRKQKRLHCV